MLCNKFEELNDFLRFYSFFITILPENFQFFFNFGKTQNPTENRVFWKIKTETQPKPVLQKPKPNQNLKFSEKPNRNPTRPWVEDTDFYASIKILFNWCIITFYADRFDILENISMIYFLFDKFGIQFID